MFTIRVRLPQAGTTTVQATDTAGSALTGSANLKVRPAGVYSLDVSATSTVKAGAAFSIMVTALGGYGEQ